MIDVVEVQLLVVHCVTPIDIDGDVSIRAKFVPETVSVEPPVVGPLTGLSIVSTGAARRDRPRSVCENAKGLVD